MVMGVNTTRIPEIPKAIILAVDPGTAKAGWCVGWGGQYLDSGTIDLGQGDVWERLGRLRVVLTELADRYDPDVVAVEEPAGDRGNKRTDRRLGNAQGVVFCVAHIGGALFVEINPMTVKATGASKDNLGFAARVVGKAKVETDEADAIGVWLATLGMLQEQAFMARVGQ